LIFWPFLLKCGNLCRFSRKLPLFSPQIGQIRQNAVITTFTAGQSLHEFCRGLDSRSLNLDPDRKSVSAEVNYGIRFEKDEDAKKFLAQLASEVGTVSMLEQILLLSYRPYKVVLFKAITLYPRGIRSHDPYVRVSYSQQETTPLNHLSGHRDNNSSTAYGPLIMLMNRRACRSTKFEINKVA
jgi:hypothetical protein